MTVWLMNWNVLGRKRPRLNRSIILAVTWREWRKAQNYLSQDSKCPSRDSNRVTPKYEPRPFFFLNLRSGGWSPNWVHSARRPLTGLLYLGWLWGWRIWWTEWQGNRSTRRKPAPAPLCPPQIPLDQIWDWTRAAAVGSQRLTASAIARPV
jgi:hypothetical protein